MTDTVKGDTVCEVWIRGKERGVAVHKVISKEMRRRFGDMTVVRD
jgi:hypothetical protein